MLTKEAKIFTGANIENASYGLSNCAERTAIFKAISEGFTDYLAIAVVADTNDLCSLWFLPSGYFMNLLKI